MIDGHRKTSQKREWTLVGGGVFNGCESRGPHQTYDQKRCEVWGNMYVLNSVVCIAVSFIPANVSTSSKPDVHVYAN